MHAFPFICISMTAIQLPPSARQTDKTISRAAVRSQQRNAYFVINLNIWTVHCCQDMTAHEPDNYYIKEGWKIYKGMKTGAEFRSVSVISRSIYFFNPLHGPDLYSSMFLKRSTCLLVFLACSLTMWCKSTSAGSSFLSPSQKPQVRFFQAWRVI